MTDSEKQVVIIAPHCDDEIIGAYDILTTKKPIIIYDANVSLERRNEAVTLKEYVDIKGQTFHKDIPSIFLNECQIFAPDPFFEINPSHRRWGFLAEQAARRGADVTFYNTIMNAPYIRESKTPNHKETLLNKVYPSQETLWKYEKKYVIYEGYVKWIF